MAYVLADHRVKYRHGAGNVVAIVTGRIPYGIANRQPRRKVHHRIHIVLANRGTQPCRVVNIADDYRRCVSRRFPMAGRQIVENNDPRALCAQRFDGVASDVPGPAGNQNTAQGRPIER